MMRKRDNLIPINLPQPYRFETRGIIEFQEEKLQTQKNEDRQRFGSLWNMRINEGTRKFAIKNSNLTRIEEIFLLCQAISAKFLEQALSNGMKSNMEAMMKKYDPH